MSNFFESQLDYIFLIYGAAFLLLIPICIFLRGRMNRTIAWAWLGWFGAAHGLNEWLDLLALSLGSGPGFDLARLGLLALSFLCLAEFGRASLARMGSRVPGRWILLVMIGLAALGGLAGLEGLFATTRYVLGLGGGLWAAVALFVAARKVPHGSRQLLTVALGMTGYALACGLVTNPAPFPPASWLNYDSFMSLTGFPIQLWRAGLAIWISVSLYLLALAHLGIERDLRFRSWFRHLMLASIVGVIVLWLGGGFITQYCGKLADEDIRVDYEHNVKVLRQAIVEKMAETDRLVKFISESPQVFKFLADEDPKNIEKVNFMLDRCSDTVQQTICYVMDPKGLTIASSNRHRPDSFVGKSYNFRPYFKEAMQGSQGRYWAFGVTSKEMGYYSSYALRDQAGNVIGVAVVKKIIDEIKNVFPTHSLGLLLDPNGIVIMANYPDLVLRSLWPLSWQSQKKLAASRQFGDGPFIPILEQKPVYGGECLFQGKRLRVLMQPGFWHDWAIVGLEPMAPITQARLLGISATVVLFLVLIGFLTVTVIMRVSEEGFRQLFENAVDILILHEKGRIVAVNQQACRDLGYIGEELSAMSLFDIEVGPTKEELLSLWEQGGELVNLACTYRRKDGSTFPVEVRAGEISYRGQNMRLASVRDVTERKRAEEALRTERQRLFNLLDKLQAFIFLGRPDYPFIYVNKYFREHFGEPGGRPCHQILYGHRNVCEKCPASKIFETGIPQEWEWTTKEGCTYQVYAYPFADVDGSPLILEMGIDITARKRAEMELQAREKVLRRSQESYRHLAKQLMTVQERERQRLGRELHDDLSQRLAVLAMEAEGLEQQLDRQSGIDPARLRDIKANLVKMSTDVHAISRRLHPSILDDLGLADAIGSECNAFRQRNGVVVNYQSANLPSKVPREIAINIYRIAQEALRNIERHARATAVDCALLGQDSTINLSIKDNGQGFDPEGKKMMGLGLASMKERALLIGAKFAIHTQPGGGTVIEVTAPFPRRRA